MRKSAIAAGVGLAIVALFALNQSRADEPVTSEGKCWKNTSNGNYGWADCKKETREVSHKHKG